MEWEPGKEYATRSGGTARVYSVEGGGRFPVHGAVKHSGFWLVESWTKEGCVFELGRVSENDLVGVRE